MRSLVPLCLALALSVAGCMVPLAAQAAEDDAIARSVAQRFAEDPELSASTLSFAVRDGVVVLHGTVTGPAQSERAEATTRSVDGVVRVENLIRVRAAGAVLGAPGRPQLVRP